MHVYVCSLFCSIRCELLHCNCVFLTYFCAHYYYYYYCTNVRNLLCSTTTYCCCCLFLLVLSVGGMLGMERTV